MTVEIKGIGKVTANKDVLNYITLLAGEAAHRYEEKGYNALAKQADKFSTEIWKALDASGLYNDFK